MDENFLVDHICITCDRIAELKLVVFSHTCYVSRYLCGGIDFTICDNMKVISHLVNIVHRTKVTLPMLDCSNLSRFESYFSYNLCLSHNVLLKCATAIYFTDICKLSCMLH